MKSKPKKSKAHVLTGEVLRKLLPHFTIIEEERYDWILRKGYHRLKVDITYWDTLLLAKARRYHCDWYIVELHLCIEVDGDQHQHIVQWSKTMTPQDLCFQFEDQQRRDETKRQITKTAAAFLLNIPYGACSNFDTLTTYIETKLGEV